jgi:mercuric ion transport protein
MRDRTLITTGAIGAVLAAMCCTTSLLVVALGAVGLTASLAKADYVLIPALILCLALVAFGLYRRRLHHGRPMHIPREPPIAAATCFGKYHVS